MTNHQAISINGDICGSNHFDWLSDSGFRYGYGCFETMRVVHGKVPLLVHHKKRLAHSLAHFSINHNLNGLDARIHALIHVQTKPVGICHLHVTAGQLHVAPGAIPSPNEIISLAPTPPPCKKAWEFIRITPHALFQHKSMAYIHHVHALTTAAHWPIYIDETNTIIDSSIFSVGCIAENVIVFAKHPAQLPSVSRDVVMATWPNNTIDYRPITTNEWLNADAHFACNAVRGAFELEPKRSTHQSLIDKMNRCLGV